jgi:hypothetical protein
MRGHSRGPYWLGTAKLTRHSISVPSVAEVVRSSFRRRVPSLTSRWPATAFPARTVLTRSRANPSTMPNWSARSEISEVISSFRPIPGKRFSGRTTISNEIRSLSRCRVRVIRKTSSVAVNFNRLCSSLVADPAVCPINAMRATDLRSSLGKFSGDVRNRLRSEITETTLCVC